MPHILNGRKSCMVSCFPTVWCILDFRCTCVWRCRFIIFHCLRTIKSNSYSILTLNDCMYVYAEVYCHINIVCNWLFTKYFSSIWFVFPILFAPNFSSTDWELLFFSPFDLCIRADFDSHMNSIKLLHKLKSEKRQPLFLYFFCIWWRKVKSYRIQRLLWTTKYEQTYNIKCIWLNNDNCK